MHLGVFWPAAFTCEVWVHGEVNVGVGVVTGGWGYHGGHLNTCRGGWLSSLEESGEFRASFVKFVPHKEYNGTN